jgi:hypothetical protein
MKYPRAKLNYHSGCISSIVRFVYVPGILHPKSIAFYSKLFPDQIMQSRTNKLSETIKPLTIICIVEMGSGILACSLATLRPLLATLVDFRTIRYSISRITSRSHDNTGRSSAMAVQKEYKEYNSDPVSSQDSELYEIQHARIASMKESFFSDADSQTGVFPERREKNLSVQPRRFDEGSEINLV